jgi:hypothetical protein
MLLSLNRQKAEFNFIYLIFYGKVKFWSKMAIEAIIAKLFFQLFSKKHEKIKKTKK